MVTSTISGTCHHEVNLARVNLFYNISFKTSTLTQYFSGYNMECELDMLWFASDTLIFSKIGRMVKCPVRVTYNHASIFVCSRTKKPLNYQVKQHLQFLNSYSCLELLSSPENFNFFSRICQMVTSAISGTCNHEVNMARVN